MNTPVQSLMLRTSSGVSFMLLKTPMAAPVVRVTMVVRHAWERKEEEIQSGRGVATSRGGAQGNRERNCGGAGML